jgi:hypothetical protein
MACVSYRAAPVAWDHLQRNPFTADGAYGPAWSHFTLRDTDDANLITGSGGTDLYGMVAGGLVERREERLADFLRYEAAHRRTVIVSAPPGLDAEALVARCLADTPPPDRPRPTDPPWLVHSTPAAAWQAIVACGEVLSSARLRRLGVAVDDQGQRAFGEPADYAEYVMLAELHRIGPELVVASHGAGTIVDDESAPYAPGVRLYFDARHVIADGLGVRDGAHTLKVRDRLPLVPYLLGAIDPAAAHPGAAVSTWTPRLFLDMANARFRALTAPRQA